MFSLRAHRVDVDGHSSAAARTCRQRQSVGEWGGEVQAESVSVALAVAVIVCESISVSADADGEVAERRSGSADSICIASILQHQDGEYIASN